jgi:polygalacturonase
MIDRRSLMLAGGAGMFLMGVPAFARTPGAENWVNVRNFGAKGDGKTIDSNAINKAIDHAAARGGGTVFFPAGTYASFTIRLKSKVTLYIDNGATILAAPSPEDGKGGYDLAEPMDPVIATYQDFGHSHWKNSLIWGEDLHDIAITGHGLIWGKGLGRGDGKDNWLKDPNGPGTGNKAIALKNCRNVILSDFQMLEGGWFALLATGVDNMIIDNLLVDTNRDGFDIDCCKNVRVSNCTVNSPYDDAICPKSSFALGYARVTENITIANCTVLGNYKVGSVLDGTWQKMPPEFAPTIHGRIKFGTETNGGFKNITITNCTFEDSRGLAFQTVDGGIVEDITVSNLTMRGIINAPIFMRLGKRMRGPKGVPIGSMKRILIQNVVSSGANMLPSVLAGLTERPIEDVKFDNLLMHHVGGAPAAMAALMPPENELGYPEAPMFGDLPASGFFMRHMRNVEMSNVEIRTAAADPRPAFWLQDVIGADFFRMRTPAGAPRFSLNDVGNFRSFGAQGRPDAAFEKAVKELVA